MQAFAQCSIIVMDLEILTRADHGETVRLCYSNPRNHGPLILPPFWGRDSLYDIKWLDPWINQVERVLLHDSKGGFDLIYASCTIMMYHSKKGKKMYDHNMDVHLSR